MHSPSWSDPYGADVPEDGPATPIILFFHELGKALSRALGVCAGVFGIVAFIIALGMLK